MIPRCGRHIVAVRAQSPPLKGVRYTVGDHIETFINDQVEGGRYASARVVIRDGLRLFEKEQRPRQAVIDGLRGEIKRGGAAVNEAAAEDLDRLERKHTKMAKD